MSKAACLARTIATTATARAVAYGLMSLRVSLLAHTAWLAAGPFAAVGAH